MIVSMKSMGSEIYGVRDDDISNRERPIMAPNKPSTKIADYPKW
jgi:hypothetical protein